MFLHCSSGAALCTIQNGTLLVSHVGIVYIGFLPHIRQLEIAHRFQIA